MEQVRNIQVPVLQNSGERSLRNFNIRVVHSTVRSDNKHPFYDANHNATDGSDISLSDLSDHDYACDITNLEEAYEKVDDASTPQSDTGSRQLGVVLCTLCDVDVQTSLKRRHIHRFHLQQPLYSCPHCSFTSQYHQGNVNKHLLKAHMQEGGVVSHKEELEGTMQALLFSCFADSLIFRHTDTAVADTVRFLVNAVCELIAAESPLPLSYDCESTTPSPSPPYLNASMELEQRPEIQASQKPCLQRFIRVRLGKRPISDGSLRSKRAPLKRTCRLCGMREIAHTERHILQYHLKQRMFCCYHCGYANTYAPSSVKGHIRSQHPDCDPHDYGDLRAVYADAISDLTEDCFPAPEARR